MTLEVNMNRERQLLKKVLDTINALDYRQGLDPLTVEIEELLAEPEQTPQYINGYLLSTFKRYHTRGYSMV